MAAKSVRAIGALAILVLSAVPAAGGPWFDDGTHPLSAYHARMGYYPYYPYDAMPVPYIGSWPAYYPYRWYSYSPDDQYATSYDPSFLNWQSPIIPQQADPQSAPTPASENRGSILIRLPSPDATVSVNGFSVLGQGSVRLYRTPDLLPGPHEYQVSASWLENGQRVSRNRTVSVQADQITTADFRKRR